MHIFNDGSVRMIKSMLRSGKKPLSQVAKRMEENTNEFLCQKHSDNKYPFVTNNNNKQNKYNKF